MPTEITVEFLENIGGRLSTEFEFLECKQTVKELYLKSSGYDSTLSLQGAWVPSLVRKDPTCCIAWQKKKKAP